MRGGLSNRGRTLSCSTETAFMRDSGSIRVVGFWVRNRAWRRRWIRLEDAGLKGERLLSDWSAKVCDPSAESFRSYLMEDFNVSLSFFRRCLARRHGYQRCPGPDRQYARTTAD
ncbi:hypothetical protein EMIT0P265_10192 [Pseudomonas zeae]